MISSDHRTVQFFATCLVDALRPQVGLAAVEILEGAGFEVEFPIDQTCCGQPAFNVGLIDEARRMAGHMVSVLEATEGPVLVPSGSCAAMLIHRAPTLFEGEEAEVAKRVAARVRELTLFLAEQKVSVQGAVKSTVAYQHSCHGLRELGVRDEPLQLLAEVEGVEIVEMPGSDECCGFGGLFSVNMPEVSEAILETKMAQIEASGAEIVAAGDTGCLLQMEGGLRRRGAPTKVCHIAELLAGVK